MQTVQLNQRANFMRWAFACCVSVLLVACTTMPVSKKNQEAASVYLQLGVRYIDMDKLEVAKENLLMALDKSPQDPQIYNALGFLYEKLNNPKQAQSYYEDALDVSPDDWGIQNNLGRFLCLQKQYPQGLALLTQAMTTQLNDKQWLALTNAGLCHLGMKQQQSAKAYFKQALLLNPSYAPALQEMQKISYQNREYWPAKAYLQRYLSVAEHTASTLWVGMQTERALGNPALAQEYQKLLQDRFPLSEEARHLPSDLP